jgi:hypothetical protein
MKKDDIKMLVDGKWVGEVVDVEIKDDGLFQPKALVWRQEAEAEAETDELTYKPAIADWSKRSVIGIIDHSLDFDPIARLQAVIDEIDLTGFPIPIHISVVNREQIGFRIQDIKPRHAPESSKYEIYNLNGNLLGRWHELPDSEFAVQVVRDVREKIIGMLAHEVDEQLLFRGRRIFDPHVLPGGTEKKKP